MKGFLLFASLLAAACATVPQLPGRPVNTRAFQSEAFRVPAPAGANWFYDVDPADGDLVLRRAHSTEEGRFVGVTAIWVATLSLPPDAPTGEEAVVEWAFAGREREARDLTRRSGMSASGFERGAGSAGDKRVHALRYRFGAPKDSTWITDHLYLLWLPPDADTARRLYYVAASVSYEPGLVTTAPEMEAAMTMLSALQPAGP